LQALRQFLAAGGMGEIHGRVTVTAAAKRSAYADRHPSV
jgi:hypothetical protein